MATPVADRVRKHRADMRKAGMREVRIWVPDTRAEHFANECRRQASIVATADAEDRALSSLLDAALDDVGGWQA